MPKPWRIHTIINTGLSDVSNSCSFDYIPNNKLLDGFVLWNTPCTVGAAHRVHMATAMFRSSTISAFASLKNSCFMSYKGQGTCLWHYMKLVSHLIIFVCYRLYTPTMHGYVVEIMNIWQPQITST